MMDDVITLPSGRSVYANQGIVGIDEEGNLYGGYDQTLDYNPCSMEELSVEDKAAVAAMMIDRWSKLLIPATK